ncbi:hypothetical protein LIX60_09430 [Streptomyces sp. S07_1.15]|uniref:PD-(D/E)XK nuclease domain-containing protein n=1 Tax=Streptomyces sp. S07_1.15 TaxID=2873925 RepID=UPI001D132C36|nr:hypothetical protein [Streptomyces sp. S07_1.15]MCC3651683.1 hypothetical protein [Streptomyces sp. S07_1.15]
MIEGIIKEVERVTFQWHEAETELTFKGKGDLYVSSESLIDARIELGEDYRDVVEVEIARRSEDYEDSDTYLSVTLCKRKSDTSWVFCSGPIKRTCEDLVRGVQAFILEAIDHPESRMVGPGPIGPANSLDTLADSLARFPSFLRDLANSPVSNIPPPRVENEKDLQVLIGACLRLMCDDVRPEDYIAEYAGGRSRVDFFLPEAGIIVETKMTRDSLTDRKVGEELLIDWGRYSSRSDCRGILAVIYDPRMLLRNPAGLAADLSQPSKNPSTKVIVIR